MRGSFAPAPPRRADPLSTEDLAIDDDLLLAALLASPATALVGIALDGTVTRWSAGVEQLLGWRADEVLGQPLPVVKAPGGQGVLDLGGRLLAGEDVPDLPLVHLHRDGSRVTVRVHLLVVRDLGGLAVGFAARYDDLDRLPVATVEQDELRLGFLDSPVPQSWTDRDGTVLAVNRAMERLLGLPAARLLGTDSLLTCVESTATCSARRGTGWPRGTVTTPATR